MKKVYHYWNTGRHYSADGQRIIFQVLDGKIIFFDKDRGISGTTHRSVPDCVSGARFALWLMGEYDACRYDGWLDREDELILEEVMDNITLEGRGLNFLQTMEM